MKKEQENLLKQRWELENLEEERKQMEEHRKKIELGYGIKCSFQQGRVESFPISMAVVAAQGGISNSRGGL